MKYSLYLLFAIFFADVCNSQQVINSTVSHDGIDRNYILFIPASYDASTPAPLVFSFHGYSSNAALNMNYTGFTAIADTAGFILVHPDGTLDGSATSHWNVGGWTVGSTVDDVGFTNLMIEEISANYNVNANRIYSTGMSNGGYMSFLLACQLSDRIAAIASVTGSMTPQTYTACNPSHPTPVLQIHGTADGTVPYEGSPTWSYGIEDVLSYWVTYNNCNTTPTITSMPDINTGDGSNVDYFVYDGGDNGVTTEHFKVYGGDHDWPGVWGNMDINASIEVWKFFSKYDINGLIAGVDETTIVDEIKVFPNPATDLISIHMEASEDLSYEITSTNGKYIQDGVITVSNQWIDVSKLTPEMYFLKIEDKVLKFVVKR
jgi:polyhydroxybutyrate depolymerase